MSENPQKPATPFGNLPKVDETNCLPHVALIGQGSMGDVRYRPNVALPDKTQVLNQDATRFKGAILNPRPGMSAPVTPTEPGDLYGGYDLQRGDQDRLPSQAPVYGGVPRPAATAKDVTDYVKKLKEDLSTLGFGGLLVPDKVGVKFGIHTELAVREFQIYAKMTHLAQETVGDSVPTRYACRLSQVENPNRYTRVDDLVCGIVNKRTRELIRYWKANHLRCPVVVEAWNMGEENSKRLTLFGNPKDKTVQKADNIWRHDEVTSSGPRMFVRDYSNYYFDGVVAARMPERVQQEPGRLAVLGTYNTYNGSGGPQARSSTAASEGHCWPEAEMTPESLTGQRLDAMVPAKVSLFKVFRSVADIEATGFYDSINAYDSSYVSLGPCHWTLGLGEGPNSKGELAGFLAYLRFSDPPAFEKTFKFFGLGVAARATDELIPRDDSAAVKDQPGWEATGEKMFSSQNKYEGFVTLPNQQGKPSLVMDEVHKNYLRSWHWFYRFAMAGRMNRGYRRAIWSMVRIRLRDLLLAKMELPDAAKTSVTIGQVFRSELAVAMLLRWHVLRPVDIITGHKAGSIPRMALANAWGSGPWSSNPDEWSNEQENKLVSQMLDLAKESIPEMQKTIPMVENWPNEVVYKRQLEQDLSALPDSNRKLSRERGSFPKFTAKEGVWEGLPDPPIM